MKKSSIVYWLLPAKPERELLCEIVRILKTEFGAPNFEPHLTLFANGSRRKAQESPAKILRRIKSAPVRLRVRGVSFTSQFTKTLFVRYKSSSSLTKLTKALGKVANTRANRPTDPHVSLVYKKLQPFVKKELAATIRFPLREMSFDTIAAVRCPIPTQRAADVRAWRILAKKKLSR